MSEITLKTRIQNKYKTLDEWNEILEGEFTPLKGEVFYATQENILYQKIGDGMTDFTKLNWLELQHTQSDWGENDSNKNSYIENRTHYRELITLTWDGNEEGYEVYGDEITEETQRNFIRYVRISDTVPFSLEELSIFGVCKYNYYTSLDSTTPARSFTSDNISNFLNDNSASIAYSPGRFEEPEDYSSSVYTAETIRISFLDDISGSTNEKVLFVLSEGTIDTKQTNLPVGIYFIHTSTNIGVLGSIKTSEYSFYCLHKLEKDLINRNLASYSSNFGHPSNQVLFSYSTAEGKENYLGPYTSSDTTLYSAFNKNIPFIDLNSHTTLNTSSHAEGEKNQVFERYCHAEGYNNQLSIKSSHIEGYNNTAGDAKDSSSVGQGSHIEGYGNRLGDSYGGHVEGYSCKGQGRGVHAEGYYTQAFEEGAHAQNGKTIASGRYSSASGQESKATATGADAGGCSTEANHAYSFTRGIGTISGAAYQAVVGQYNEIFDDSLFDVGNGTAANRKTAFSVKADGSARLQTQGETEDSIARKDYVDSSIANSSENIIKEILTINNSVNSWERVQKIVRAGYAPLVFNIGDQLTCNSEQFGELTWDIIGFDQDIPSDSQYTHSMTLHLHNILDTTPRNYDHKSYIYCTETELSAGTYYFYYNTKLDKSANNIYLQLIVNTGSVIPQGAKLTGTSLTSMYFYLDDQTCWSGKLVLKGSTVPTDGTILGEINYYNINGGGSYYYPTADIRTFLNGEDEMLNWIPANNLEMTPNYINSPGFLYKIDSDFKKVLGTVKKKTYNLQTQEIEELDELIFLPSGSELFGTNLIDREGNEINMGDPYDYYRLNSVHNVANNAADDNRIKYNYANNASAYYLRSPHSINPTTANNASMLTKIQVVNNNGLITAGQCEHSTTYLAPCCCIV